MLDRERVKVGQVIFCMAGEGIEKRRVVSVDREDLRVELVDVFTEYTKEGSGIRSHGPSPERWGLDDPCLFPCTVSTEALAFHSNKLLFRLGEHCKIANKVIGRLQGIQVER